jgi:hypothetical protein
MQTKHAELLPALLSALRMQEILTEHPEAAELYREWYGPGVAAEILTISHDIKMGNVDPPRIVAQVARIERRLSHLAAPEGRNWN